MNNRVIGTFLICIALVSCASHQPSQVAAGIGRGVMAVGSLGISELAYANAEKAKSTSDAEDDVKCIEWGAPKGSTAYLDCRIKLQSARNSRPTIINNTSTQPRTIKCTRYDNTTAKCVEE